VNDRASVQDSQFEYVPSTCAMFVDSILDLGGGGGLFSMK
jgi:hypothetical protein